MITASTHQKRPFFNSPEKKDRLQEILFQVAEEFGWNMEAWAILSNHYHLVLKSPEDSGNFPHFINKFHAVTARNLNVTDRTPGRKVWFQYWDTRITHRDSYLARLAYVHLNPVHHGLVERAESYPWCSAAWFCQHASGSLQEEVLRFRTDRLMLGDDF